jgi:ribonuclease P protein subunit RPR2
MRRYKKQSKAVIETVRRRIDRLLSQAMYAAPAEPERAKRYVTMARKLSQKNKVRMPYGSSRRFCRNCNAYFVPGRNVRIRTREGKQIYYCLGCKRIKRFVLNQRR